MSDSNEVPDLPRRVVRRDSRQRPIDVYSASPDVIVRLASALRQWDPGCELSIDTEASTPIDPLWTLRRWR